MITIVTQLTIDFILVVDVRSISMCVIYEGGAANPLTFPGPLMQDGMADKEKASTDQQQNILSFAAAELQRQRSDMALKMSESLQEL